jgi:class 3 adenylate cyclase
MDDAEIVRRLTTILAADVVGYSRLMAADEEATLSRLKAYRTVIDGLIARHEGRIFNTAGDAVFAEFASAVEAVRCAVSIQEDLAARNTQLREEQQMWFRIGINVGDVMIDGQDLFGDGVNIAARLEGLAEKGGICISGGTFEQVKNKLSLAFKDIGPQSVKNIPDAISAYRIVPGQVSVRSDRNRKNGQPFAKKAGRGYWIAICGVAVIAIVTFFLLFQLRKPVEISHPFDGNWQVNVHSRSGCQNNEDTSYSIRVVNGMIDEPTHSLPKKGSITDDGNFRIDVSSSDGRPMNTQVGTINGDKGEGKLTGARPRCTGSVSIARVN